MPNEKYHKIYGQNQDQGEKWNSKMGLAWVKNDAKMNSLLEVMTGQLLKELGQLEGKQILDIGCGSGEISKLLLAKAGSNGNVQGVDISKPLLELAFKKYGHMQNIKFLNADAQSFRFKLSFYDQIISRFGVMFFENPVAAFRNMHRSLKSNGTLDFICWSALEDNEFFFLPLQIVLKYLNKPHPKPSTEPGPLAFSSKSYLSQTLESSGFNKITIKTINTEMLSTDPINTQITFFNQIGLAARIKKEAPFDTETHKKIDDELKIELIKRSSNNCTKLKATVHYVSASA